MRHFISCLSLWFVKAFKGFKVWLNNTTDILIEKYFNFFWFIWYFACTKNLLDHVLVFYMIFCSRIAADLQPNCSTVSQCICIVHTINFLQKCMNITMRRQVCFNYIQYKDHIWSQETSRKTSIWPVFYVPLYSANRYIVQHRI